MLKLESVKPSAGKRILIYGTGGVGKTTLACLAPSPVAFIDADNSLPDLREELESIGVESPMHVAVSNWTELRAALHSDGWSGIKTIVLDSVTVIEEWCIKNVLATQRTFDTPPQKANSLEDYGYGKDVRLVYEAFLPLLGDLDRHAQAGRNIILLAHECKPEEVNPEGGNYVRYEPRLRTSKKGDNSIRLKVKEWCSHVGFLSYDIIVGENKKKDDYKKGKGNGTRTLYFGERPYFMAKKRGSCDESISITYGESPWLSILK